MRKKFALSLAACAVALSVPASAEMAVPSGSGTRASGAPGTANGPELQCVPYARQLSGVQIYGDAHTWWGQAEGRYARGHTPRVGAVMAFEPHRNMRLGHVAAVSQIIDSRTVLLSHSNWSEINGRRGQIENNVRAVDVSPNNDWSEVRVWYAPIEGLGTTAWPVHGFIYNEEPGSQRAEFLLAFAPAAMEPAATVSQPARVQTARVQTAARSNRTTQRHSARPAQPTRGRVQGELPALQQELEPLPVPASLRGQGRAQVRTQVQAPRAQVQQARSQSFADAMALDRLGSERTPAANLSGIY